MAEAEAASGSAGAGPGGGLREACGGTAAERLGDVVRRCCVRVVTWHSDVLQRRAELWYMEAVRAARNVGNRPEQPPKKSDHKDAPSVTMRTPGPRADARADAAAVTESSRPVRTRVLAWQVAGWLEEGPVGRKRRLQGGGGGRAFQHATVPTPPPPAQQRADVRRCADVRRLLALASPRTSPSF
jgi:hypothetical protein